MRARLLPVLIAAGAAMAQSHLVEGSAQSAVRVIVYEDLQCSDCAAFRQMLDERLLPRYARQVAFEHRDFPLPRHLWAKKAAIAARHFERIRPELAIEWRRHALATRKETTPENLAARLKAFAATHGADGEKAVAALEDPALARLVEADLEEGVARGVARTPTVFVNGEPFVETFTFEEIAKAIDAALKP